MTAQARVAGFAVPAESAHHAPAAAEVNATLKFQPSYSVWADNQDLRGRVKTKSEGALG